MTWKIINAILGHASVDPEFCEELLTDPLVAIDHVGYQLTPAERQIIHAIQLQDIQDIHDFSAQLLLKMKCIP
jgi:hypothetical protein